MRFSTSVWSMKAAAWAKEVERMKQTLPVVHCIYTEAEKSLAELLEESFRLYLVRILATSEETVVQCLR